MRTIRLSCFVVLMLSASAFAQPTALWINIYGGPTSEDCNAAVAATDSGYVLAGSTTSFGSGSSDFWLVKIDSEGDSLWSRAYGGTGEDQCSAVTGTSDGGYMLAGYTFSFANGDADGWLVKTDSNGDSVWARNYTPGSLGPFFAVIQTADGGYLAAGFADTGDGNWDFWLLKTDANGDSLWSKTYGGANAEECHSIIPAVDGGYILAGTTSSFGSGSSDFWMLKVDEDGDSLWSHTYGRGSGDDCSAVIQTADGGYALTGLARIPASDFGNYLLVKTNADGDSLWSRVYGGSGQDIATSVVQTSDSGYAIAGYSASFAGAGFSYWLLKTDVDGDSLWNIEVSQSTFDECRDLVYNSDGTYLLAGDRRIDGTNNKFMAIKIADCSDAAPDAPELIITPESSNTRLSWDPIATGYLGCPVTPEGYLLWYSPVEDDPYYFLAYTTDTTYVHPGVIEFAEGMFYYAETYVGDPVLLERLPRNPEARFTREEIQRLLR